MRDIILRLKDLTMIYASHQLSEIERFCNRVIFIHEGHILHQSGLNEIATEVFTLELTRPALEVLPQFAALQPELSEGQDERVEVRLIATADEIQGLIAALNARGAKILRLRSRGILEDLYHRYVTEAREAGDTPGGKKPQPVSIVESNGKSRIFRPGYGNFTFIGYIHGNHNVW